MADWSPLRALLADVDTSVTLAWGDLDALVSGLPKSAHVHNAFWKGERSGWPGFKATAVMVRESVTFVRTSTQPGGRRALEARSRIRAAHGEPDLILVGCVKQKLSVAAPAKDLYISTLFRKASLYAERAGAPWFILSAEHGLVHPEEELAPYDLQLSKTTRAYRQAWGGRVVDQLAAVVGSLADKTIEVHAGAAYASAIRPLLSERGVVVLEPLAGLKLGPRLSWYSTENGEPTESGPEIADLLTRLTLAFNSMTPAEFLATGGNELRSPGLYSWWVDPDGAADLSRGLSIGVLPGLIYAGLAGATRAKSGRKSKNTLWGRIKTMHLGGRHEFSTFRLSLGSILAEAHSDVEIDEEALTAWMHEHLRLIAVPVADPDTLGAVETDVLAALNPPLNLDKVKRDPLRTRLTDLRKKYGRKRRGPSSP